MPYDESGIYLNADMVLPVRHPPSPVPYDEIGIYQPMFPNVMPNVDPPEQAGGLEMDQQDVYNPDTETSNHDSARLFSEGELRGAPAAVDPIEHHASIPDAAPTHSAPTYLSDSDS